ncbi:MAG: hypothetical protein H7245_00775 [Candidatus Saccharibacteria bacterium]|nr:hypothetical protein [Pseudorhodobacter sp.]
MGIDDSRHEVLTVKIDLTPSTGYVFDIEARTDPAVAAPPSPYPLFRRSFRTSRYADAQAMAAAIKAGKLGHRFVDDATALTGLPDGTVPDMAFEAALRAAGWGEFRRGTMPRTTVIWTGNPAQPSAILLEPAEPTWRQRQVAVKQVKDGVTAYVHESRIWLDIVEASGAGVVTKIVRASDGIRTLVVLGAGAGGKRALLNLRRTHHPLYEGDSAASVWPIAAIDLTAPWEDPA